MNTLAFVRNDTYLYAHRPGERTMTDVQYVAELLRSITTLRDLPHELILDLASCAYLEDLEEGVTRE